MQHLDIDFLGEQLKLSPYKVIFWEKQKMLLVSDVHLGKAGHFRKSGVAVPAHIHFGDLHRLSELIKLYSPDTIAFLGDLFHSDYNTDWDYFCEWLLIFPQIKFLLIRGNHDILFKLDYVNAELELLDELIIGPFSFTHEKIDSPKYNISGHIHPSVSLKGMARQNLRLPCFYFGEKYGIMPAFGSFTGFAVIEPKRQDSVFVIAEDQVIQV